ncbi:MAG: hypothetical protein KAS72_13370 [Phycisphaerales bacterium]|nr:hypothetical protein [Phycisphaerales bacterium]
MTEPRCPECRQSLSLTVGSAEIRLRWFLAAITPGLFSGIAAAFLMIPIVIASVSGFGPPWDVIGIDAFGWTSGLVALGLMARRRTFLRQSSAVQRAIAIGLWAIHALVLALLLAGAP